jgi:hypothetical protein
LVYRIDLLPNPQATAEIWRREAERFGLPGIFLVSIESNYVLGTTSPAKTGFDGTVRFQPNFTASSSSPVRAEVVRAIKERYPRLYRSFKSLRRETKDDKIHEYAALYRRWRDSASGPERRFECVTPMWDNSARRYRGATIVQNSTPQLYEQWLREAVQRSVPDSDQQTTVFINAWNEWAEGCHLEPCQKWGRQYLEATKRVYQSI